MWKIGDRVLAHRRPGIFWYPGTVRHIDGERLYVIFDDGQDDFVVPPQLTACRFEPGDQVFVREADAAEYTPAQVKRMGDGKLCVLAQGREQWVTLDRVRIHPETWKQPVPVAAAPAAPRKWNVCDRVLACWYDLDWYPGIVLSAEPDRIHVLFDTGNHAALAPSKVRPLTLRVGDRVFGRWKAGEDYYSGRITSLDGEKVHISYDDGDEETTSVRLLRLRRDEWFPNNPAMTIRTGARVLACWYDLYWYPGIVLSVDGKRIHIAYDDGDQALVTPDQIAPLDIGVGSRVYCRFKGGPQYLPGEVAEQKGETILVHYDNGNKEWTSVRMVRVER